MASIKAVLAPERKGAELDERVEESVRGAIQPTLPTAEVTYPRARRRSVSKLHRPAHKRLCPAVPKSLHCLKRNRLTAGQVQRRKTEGRTQIADEKTTRGRSQDRDRVA